LNEYSVADNEPYWRFWKNLRALYFKRSKLEQRRWKYVFLSELVIPIVFVLIGIWIT
jgi:hypothetical protein